MNIPEEIKARLPLILPEHMNLLVKLKEHEHSPIWNYDCGDRIREEDLSKIENFKIELYKRQKGKNTVSKDLMQWVYQVKDKVKLFRKNTENLEIHNDFFKIKCMTREDIAKSLESIIPEDVSLDRLIVNSTSGTTGHPIITPNHPVSIGCYTPLLLFALEQHGINLNFTKENVGCMLICAQKETAVYSTVVPMLNGTGFAKINLHPNSWKSEEGSTKFINDFAPLFFTGDPFSFSELLKLELNFQPAALVSTSMLLSNALRIKLENRFKTKVIDYYSLNETGPLGYSCPVNPEEFHILPMDIFLEITDDSGDTLPEHTQGEITVTGGRNPYIPLLRYKTGDRGKINNAQCSCGDPSARLYDLEMRKQVIFYTKNNLTVNQIDISRILKKYPILQFEFLQKLNLSCVLSIRKLHEFGFDQEDNLRQEIEILFQSNIELEINFNLKNNGEKLLSFRSEITNSLV